MILTNHSLFPHAKGFRTHAAALRHAQKAALLTNDQALIIVASRRQHNYDDHVVIAVLTADTNIYACNLANINVLCVSA